MHTEKPERNEDNGQVRPDGEGKTKGGGKARPTEDLSHEIRRTVAREPGEIVRCTRVGENAYRCNWWTSAASAMGVGDDDAILRFLLVTTSRVGRSRFLTAARIGDQIVIEDATADGAR